MSLLGLLAVLLIVAVVVWAARTLITAFNVPQPVGTVIYVIIVLLCVLWLVSALGVFPSGPLIRIR